MIAITGSSGFIGRSIVEALPFPQKRLVRTFSDEGDDRIIFFAGDIKDPIDPFLADSKTLIHLAWKGSPRTPLSHAEMENTLLPTFHLFRRYAELNPKGHIVFASSGGNIYGKAPHGEAFTEEDQPNPLSPYSHLKLAAEGFLPLLASEYGVGATIMRISNPYGVLLPGSRGQGLIGIALSKLMAGETLEIFDSLSAVRDYLHVADLAKAFQVIVQIAPEQGTCRTYNISSGKGYSSQEVLTLIQEISEQSLDIKIACNEVLPSWSPERSVLSFQKIERELGWAPKVSLRDGIQAMWHKVSVSV